MLLYHLTPIQRTPLYNGQFHGFTFPKHGEGGTHTVFMLMLDNALVALQKKEDMAEFTRRSVAVSKGPPIHVLSHSPTPGWRSETAQSE